MDPQEKMVQTQIERRGISNSFVLAAMRKVRREDFVPNSLIEAAYEDSPLPIEEGQTISQPYIVAWMAEALELTPDSRILEIGTGSGYAAAVFSHIAKEVFSVEYFPYLAKLASKRLQTLGITNVHIRQGDGALGWKEEAPFQGISVAAAAREIPSSLLEQLDVGGKLIMPIGASPLYQELIRVIKKDVAIYEYEALGEVRFVPLQRGTPHGR